MTARAAALSPAGWVPVSWRRQALDDVLSGTAVQPVPTLLTRTDGASLLYPGRLHSVHGETESLKSWLVLYAAKQELDKGHTGLYLDFEDSADTVVGRLLALGCTSEAVDAHFRYVRPMEPVVQPELLARDVAQPLLESDPTLVVLDGVTEAMSLLGYDPLSNANVASFIAHLPRPFTSGGAAVGLVDHVTKNNSSGRYAIGGQHKLADLTAPRTWSRCASRSGTAGTGSPALRSPRTGPKRSGAACRAESLRSCTCTPSRTTGSRPSYDPPRAPTGTGDPRTSCSASPPF